MVYNQNHQGLCSYLSDCQLLSSLYDHSPCVVALVALQHPLPEICKSCEMDLHMYDLPTLVVLSVVMS